MAQHYKDLLKKAEEVSRMLSGLINSLKEKVL
jgi:hypothetical protein